MQARATSLSLPPMFIALFGLAVLLAALFTTRASAQVRLVKDLVPGSNGSAPAGTANDRWFAPPVTWEGAVYFWASKPDPVGGAVNQLWRTNGQEGGTFPIHEGTFSEWFTIVDGLLFFGESTSRSPKTRLWVTDGRSNTRLVKELPDGRWGKRVSFDGKLFFTIHHRGNDVPYLYESDGTASGTKIFHEINGRDVAVYDMAVLGESLLLSTKWDNRDAELYRSNGTPGGTSLLRDIDPNGESHPRDFRVIGSACFFSARTEATGREPWVTTVSSLGAGWTVPIGNLNGDDLFVRDSNPRDFVGSSYPPTPGSTLIQTDIYFTAEREGEGRELWYVSNFAISEPIRVRDIQPDELGSGIERMTPISGGRIVFTADDGLHGQELWISEPQVAGDPSTPRTARMLKDINPPAYGRNRGSEINQTFAGSTKVYFSAFDGNTQGLWQTDGTINGTVMIHGSALPRLPYSRSTFASLGCDVLFRGSTPGTGSELFAVFDEATSSATTVGHGCDFGAPGPSLTTDRPVSDSTIELRLSQVPPSQLMYLALGYQSPLPSQLGPCEVYIDWNLPHVIWPFPVPGTSFNMDWRVPNLPSLICRNLMLQAGFLKNDSHLATTNGVLLHIGRY